MSIRSLLEHVGIDTTGHDIRVADRVVDAWAESDGQTPAPRTAAEAAHLLAKRGKHVHIVSEGHSTCLAGTCGPTPLPLPAATQARANAIRLSLAVGIHRI